MPDKNNTWPRIAGRIAIHVLIVFFVMLIPPLLYDAVSKSSYQGNEALLFAGGLTYPAYLAYWITRLKSGRAKFILLHLLAILTVMFLVLAGSGRTMPDALLFLPLILTLLPLAPALWAGLRHNQRLLKTSLLSVLASLPICLVLSALLLYGMGMSAMSGMRW